MPFSMLQSDSLPDGMGFHRSPKTPNLGINKIIGNFLLGTIVQGWLTMDWWNWWTHVVSWWLYRYGSQWFLVDIPLCSVYKPTSVYKLTYNMWDPQFRVFCETWGSLKPLLSFPMERNKFMKRFCGPSFEKPIVFSTHVCNDMKYRVAQD